MDRLKHKESIDFTSEIGESSHHPVIYYPSVIHPQPIFPLAQQEYYSYPNTLPMMDDYHVPQNSVSSVIDPFATLSEFSFETVDHPYHKFSSLEEYRNAAKMNPDPLFKFNFVLFLKSLFDKLEKSAKNNPKKQKSRFLLQNEAVKWIKKLATESSGIGNLGYAEAQHLLADWYSSGIMGLQVDHEKAFSLYLQAAKQSHANSVYKVAVCHEVGLGVKKDYPKAIQYYRKAVGLGHAGAMYKLGMYLIHGGLGMIKNPREGVLLLKRSATLGENANTNAMYELL
jgi:hypothetical protein